MDKLIDPKYSHLVHKFVDSPKNGLSIELYNKQSAYSILAKLRGMYKDMIDITSGGEKINVILKSDD